MPTTLRVVLLIACAGLLVLVPALPLAVAWASNYGPAWMRSGYGTMALFASAFLTCGIALAVANACYENAKPKN